MKTRLEGEHSILRALEKKDAPALKEQANDKDVSRYTTSVPHPYTLKNARDFITYAKKARELRKEYIFGIEIKKTGALAGVISLMELDVRKQKRAELGYWIGKAYWGKGITTKAVQLILEYAFNTLKLHRVYAYVIAENSASQRVLEKTGFRKEARELKSHVKDGIWHDVFMYAQLEEEFNT
ncbi:hypothetical protein COT72_05465 [archaeon CG10_big_fil_rev_8_21_14_0_10_43_11]|nr:MAG: hypothetical protein COT72_05465 [archaeon CG10_big_fil_rev_8_21_14_0_10_43_11]